MMRAYLFLFLIVLSISSYAQKTSSDKMAWWNEAKFGMFVHWGPYSLYGGVYNGFQQRRGGAEWIMNRCKIPVMEYRAKASTFNPVHFNADSLVLMAKNAGMRYVVFTTKHHDGFAMFKSDASKFNIVDYTPFKRDIVDEVVKACRRHGLRIGFYYSQSQDWCNAGGATARKEMKEGWANPDSIEIDQFTKNNRGAWDYKQKERTFDEYFHQVAIPQMKELMTRYSDVATIFFDTPTFINDEEAEELHKFMNNYPNVIINDRLKRPNYPGDYKTPEGRIPKPEDVVGVYWETCMNIGSSWGYKSWDKNWKSPETILKTIITIAARGGNLLLNVGPDSLGDVQKEAKDCLNGVGEWMNAYGDFLYGSERSLVYPSWGEVVRSDKGRTTELYLCVYDMPADGNLVIDQAYDVKSAELYKKGNPLKFKKTKGQTIVSVPSGLADSKIPVIKLTLRKKLAPIVLESNSEKYFKIADED